MLGDVDSTRHHRRCDTLPRVTATASKRAPAKKAVAKPKPAPTVEQRPLIVWYIGNFRPEHSTENHVAEALANVGVAVTKFQEDDFGAKSAGNLLSSGCTADFILWTRTRWGADIQDDLNRQARLTLRLARSRGVPVVGYHLDIWWGLKRDAEVSTEPFFDVDLLVTADGGHDDLWARAGVNHLWMPPAISRRQAEVGTRRDEFRSPIAFVGSHDGGYHPEHAHRHELVRWLRQNYRRDCAFWPRPGQHAIRGADLQDLYASVDVVVGDSCFAGTGLARYVSDRLPETTGRAGFLLHPRVTGVTDGATWSGGPTWTEGEHLRCWDAGNWEELGATIEHALANHAECRSIAEAAHAHVRRSHTYEQRMLHLVDILRERNMLGA